LKPSNLKWTNLDLHKERFIAQTNESLASRIFSNTVEKPWFRVQRIETRQSRNVDIVMSDGVVVP
jgi:hypothetical protein